MMRRERPADVIEASRLANGIPEMGWDWMDCAAGCGDIVWLSDDQMAATKIPLIMGAVAVIVCSSTCTQVMIERQRI